MKYWIDNESENNNVICITKTSILIASCDKEHEEATQQHLNNKKDLSEIFGSDDIQSIPFIQIQTINSRSTDSEIDVIYKAKKDQEEISLDFGSLDKKKEAIQALGIILPDTLAKNTYQQSRAVAAIAPVITLISLFLTSFLFINKFRWITIIVGGLAILASTYMTFTRITNPPVITRWKVKEKYTRKAINHVKTGFSYLAAAALVLGLWSKFPDSYGEKSLYAQMHGDELSVEDLNLYLERGANINWLDDDGETPLSLAMGWEETTLAIAIVNAGANLDQLDSNGNLPLYNAIYTAPNEALVAALLDKGAKTNFTIDGQSLIQYCLDVGEEKIAKLLTQYEQSS